MRNLSQRSASAAKEIKGLIQDSVIKAETGSKLVNASGEKLTAIVDAVEKVAEMINKVDEAAASQTTGIEQINEAVGSMESMTQQNAALVEQAAASSASMSQQAQDMNQLLGFFKTGVSYTNTTNKSMNSVTKPKLNSITKATSSKTPEHNGTNESNVIKTKKPETSSVKTEFKPTPKTEKPSNIPTTITTTRTDTLDEDSEWDAF